MHIDNAQIIRHTGECDLQDVVMSRDDYMDIVGRATQEAKAEDMESVATRIR